MEVYLTKEVVGNLPVWVFREVCKNVCFIFLLHAVVRSLACLYVYDTNA